jgi:hypothetical protein
MPVMAAPLPDMNDAVRDPVTLSDPVTSNEFIIKLPEIYEALIA